MSLLELLAAAVMLRMIGGARWEDFVRDDDDLEEASRLARGGPEVDEG